MTLAHGVGAAVGLITDGAGAELGGGFTGLDWVIVGLALVAITVMQAPLQQMLAPISMLSAG